MGGGMSRDPTKIKDGAICNNNYAFKSPECAFGRSVVL